MKKLLSSIILSLTLLTSAQAQVFSEDPYLDYAITGQAADVGITAGMISTGDFVELNPLGLGLLVVKPTLVYQVNKNLEGEERDKALHGVGAVGWAAFWHNVAIAVGAGSGAGVIVFIGSLWYELSTYEPRVVDFEPYPEPLQ